MVPPIHTEYLQPFAKMFLVQKIVRTISITHHQHVLLLETRYIFLKSDAHTPESSEVNSRKTRNAPCQSTKKD